MVITMSAVECRRRLRRAMAGPAWKWPRHAAVACLASRSDKLNFTPELFSLFILYTSKVKLSSNSSTFVMFEISANIDKDL